MMEKVQNLSYWNYAFNKPVEFYNDKKENKQKNKEILEQHKKELEGVK